MNISSTLTNLELPPEEYIVVGSGVLNALKLRESNDIDLVVSEALFEHLAGTGNWERQKSRDDLDIQILEHGQVEAFLTWDDPEYKPNLKSLQQDQLVIEDIPYVSLDRLRQWKKLKGRTKDVSDVRLIDKYLQKRNH